MWVLLHGFTGSARSFDPVLSDPAMPPGDCFALALHGHQPRWREHGVASFEDELQRIAEQLRRLPEPRFLCGYSLGARVSLGLLLQNPGLIEAAVLIGVHPGLADPVSREERRRVDAQRAQKLRSEGLTAFVDDWESLPLFATQRKLEPSRLHTQREVRLSHDPEGLAQSLLTLGLGQMPDYSGRLRALSMPVTLMAGELDEKFVGLARSMLEHLPQGRLEVVPDAGHNLPLEAPHSVAQALQEAELQATAAQ